jgi:hypothetical protein
MIRTGREPTMIRLARILHAASALAVAGALICPSGEGLAQPMPPGPQPRPAPLTPPRPKAAPTKPPTEEQINKRLQRVKRRAEERRAKREQRQRDRRKALRKKLRRMLRGAPITPDVRAGLQEHARRTARLRRIREIAAEKRDYDVVVRVDKLIKKQDSSHDRWLRQLSTKKTP